MMRKKPIKNVGVLGRLDIEPKEAVGFYIESKQQNKNFIKPPNNDSPGADTIELLAYETDQEHQTMLDLRIQLTEHSNLQKQITEMHAKAIQKIISELRQGFIQTNAFMKECDEKKQVAKAAVMVEQKYHEEQKKANAKSRKDIKVLGEFKENLLAVVKELEPYEKIMEQVVAENKHRFSSVKDCMDRCDAIILTNVEIEKMKKEKAELILTRQKIMIKLCHEAAIEVLRYMNELSALKRDYDRASCNCLKWERVLNNIKDTLSENALLRLRISEGIKLMYRALCHRRGLDCNEKQVIGQLDFIRDEIRILKKVLQLCNNEKSRRRGVA